MAAQSLKNVDAYILAGGSSRRLSGKLRAEIGGVPMVQVVYRTLCRLFGTAKLVVKSDLPLPGLPSIRDTMDIQSPMTGIHSALLDASTDWIFICGGDNPGIQAGTIRYLWAHKQEGTQCIVPVVNSVMQPVTAFYRQDILDDVHNALESNRLVLTDLITSVHHHAVNMDDYAESLKSINTVDDLREFTRKT